MISKINKINMQKYHFKKYLILFLTIVFLPNTVFAANVYFETSKTTVSAGDTFIVKVKMDSETTDINSAEGSIIIGSQGNSFIVNDLVLAESAFTLWPQSPSLLNDNSISFAGGVPGGINTDGITLFNIIIEANEEGGIKFSPQNVNVFVNDGKGTKIPARINDLIVKVDPKEEGDVVNNEWLDLVKQDKTPPSVPLINIGREYSIFEGKRFAFFTAIDEESGISHYEVSEDGGPAVKSDSMYILRNQDDNITPDLVVTVYDNAGNKTTASYQPPSTTTLDIPLNLPKVLPTTLPTVLPIVLGAVIIILILIFLLIRTKRKNKK